MKTLVTGAGLVGCHVAQKLAETGENPILFEVAPRMDYIASVVPRDKVTVIVGDVSDMGDLVHVIQKEKVKQIVHTAYMLTGAATERPLAGVRVNIGGMANVLEAARITGIKRVVFPSSITVYAGASANKSVKRPYTEDIALKTVSERPTTIYNLSKLTCEHLGEVYHDVYGVEFAALRLAGVFGPFKPKTAGGLNNVMIREIIDAALSGKAIVLERPRGWPIPREFIYAKDVASAFVSALNAKQLESMVYNVGLGKFHDFADVVNIAREVIPGAEIEAKKATWTEPESAVTGWYYNISQPNDISLTERELGFIPEYDMGKAIADFVDWIKING